MSSSTAGLLGPNSKEHQVFNSQDQTNPLMDYNQPSDFRDTVYRTVLNLGRFVTTGAALTGMISFSHLNSASAEQRRPTLVHHSDATHNRYGVTSAESKDSTAPATEGFQFTARTYSTILTADESIADIEGKIHISEIQANFFATEKTNDIPEGDDSIELLGRKIKFTRKELDKSTDKALISEYLTPDPVEPKVTIKAKAPAPIAAKTAPPPAIAAPMVAVPAKASIVDETKGFKFAARTYSTRLTVDESIADLEGKIDILEDNANIFATEKTNHIPEGSNPIEPLGSKVTFTKRELDQSTDKALIPKYLKPDPAKTRVRVIVKKPAIIAPETVAVPEAAPPVSAPVTATTPVSAPAPATASPTASTETSPTPVPVTAPAVSPVTTVAPTTAPVAPVTTTIPAVTSTQLAEYGDVLGTSTGASDPTNPSNPVPPVGAAINSVAEAVATPATAPVAPVTTTIPAVTSTQLAEYGDVLGTSTGASDPTNPSNPVPPVATSTTITSITAVQPPATTSEAVTTPPKAIHTTEAERRRHRLEIKAKETKHTNAIKEQKLQSVATALVAQASSAVAKVSIQVQKVKVPDARHRAEVKARDARRKAARHLGRHSLKTTNVVPESDTQSKPAANSSPNASPVAATPNNNTTDATGGTQSTSNETPPTTTQQSAIDNSETQTNPNQYNFQQYTPQVITAGQILSGQAVYSTNNLTAYQQAEIQYTGDPDDTDCARAVTKILEASGIDPNVYADIVNRLDGGTDYLAQYFANNKALYKEVNNLGNTSNLSPGAIFIVNTPQAAHTFMYIGNNQFVSASLGGHPPQIGSMSEIDTSTGEYGQNGANFVIYDFIGSISQETYNQQAQSMGFETVPSQYLGYLDQAAQEISQYSSLDLATIKGLLAAQINQESRWNANVPDSSAGAEGIVQLMPATAQALDVDPSDPSSAIPGMGKLMAQNLEIVQQNFPDITDPLQQYQLAIAMYNSNPQTVISSGGVPNIGQTMTYVVNILGSYHIYTVMVDAMENQNALIDSNGNLAA